MTKSAEMIWLDAIEANEAGDRATALSLAEEVVSIDAVSYTHLTLPTNREV